MSLFGFTNVYPSSYDEWQSLEFILDIMNVDHAFIGTHQYKGKNYTQLAKSEFFLFDSFYNLDVDHTLCKLTKLEMLEVYQQ